MTTILVDAQLPPSLARLIREEFEVQAEHVEDAGLREATDRQIAAYAQETGAFVITKDQDYVELAQRRLVPGVILLTCGNVSNESLRAVVRGTLRAAIGRLEAGAPLVEVHDESSLP